MKIYAPNGKYNGMSAGVRFVGGVGETDNGYLIDWFKNHGYKTEVKTQTNALEDMKMDELKAYAEAHGIETKGMRSKTEVLEAIKGLGDEDDGQPEGKGNT